MSDIPDYMRVALSRGLIPIQPSAFSMPSGTTLSGYQIVIISGLQVGQLSISSGTISGAFACFVSGICVDAIVSGYRANYSSGIITPSISGLLSVQMSGAISGRVATSDNSGNLSWQASTGGGGTINIKQTEVNWGDANFQTEKTFTITDADVSTTSQILASIANEAVSGKDADENEVDSFVLIAKPAAGTFDLFIKSLEGSVYGGYLVNYLVG